jgi:hypothetical protein
MVDDRYLLNFAMNSRKRNFCGCGFAANGEEGAQGEEPAVDINQRVINLQAWRYARTALLLIGAYVVIKFAYEKLRKK